MKKMLAVIALTGTFGVTGLYADPLADALAEINALKDRVESLLPTAEAAIKALDTGITKIGDLADNAAKLQRFRGLSEAKQKAFLGRSMQLPLVRKFLGGDTAGTTD